MKPLPASKAITRRGLLRGGGAVVGASVGRGLTGGLARVGVGAAASSSSMSLLASCRQLAARDEVPGILLDPGLPLGHQLRDVDVDALLANLPPAAQTPEHVWDAIIVGGGVAGLSVAWRLHHAGVTKVLLLELDQEVGGTARSGSTSTTAYPWGAHYVTAPLADSTLMVRLLDELSVFDGVDDHGQPTVAEEVAVREPEERLWAGDRFYEGLLPEALMEAGDEADFVRFQELLEFYAGLRDGAGRPAFAIPRALCSTDPTLMALDAISFREFLLQQGFTSRLLYWFCEYAVRDDDGVDLDEASAWVGLFYFCARRRPGMEERSVLTWAEGNGRLVRHLRARSQVEVKTSQAVLDVGMAASTGEARDSTAVVTVMDAAGVASQLRAKQVVVCTPRFVAQRIIRPLRRASSSSSSSSSPSSSFSTSAWVVANVHLRERPPTKPRLPWPRLTGAEQVPFAWDTVFLDSESLGYVTATHQSGRDHGPTVLSWYLPLTGRDPLEARRTLWGTDHQTWAQRCLADLEVAHPSIRDVVEGVDVCRWGHAMVRPVPGTFSDGRLENAARSHGDGGDGGGCIHVAHSDLSGMALFEESLHHGVVAAEKVLAGLGIAAPSFLDAAARGAGLSR